jgi:predicted nucleotidyltransferase component of viral defense system
MEIIDRPALAHHLAFKGGTCASMLGYLDRFSVDLDFDVLPNTDEKFLRQEFHQVIDNLGLNVSGELKNALFFQLRYPNAPGKRNTIKISANSFPPKANQYKVLYFTEIDRVMNSQTLETMVANKLVTVTDRYHLHHTIAGRDIYDVHYFLVHGYSYHAPVISERTRLAPKDYLEKLIEFIKDKVTQTIINEDLNTLLSPNQFQQIRKILIPETISLLTQELSRLNTKQS